MAYTQVTNIAAANAAIAELYNQTDALLRRMGDIVLRPAYNYLINGGFDVWQRGTSFATIGYSADRWRASGNMGASTASQVAVNDADGKYGLQFLITTKGGSFTDGGVIQALETVDSVRLRGRTVTFGVKLLRNTSFNAGSCKISIFTGTGTDEPGVTTGRVESKAYVPYSSLSTTNYQVFTVVATVPMNATQIGVFIGFDNSTVFPDGSAITARSAQLTISGHYADCEVRTLDEEIRKCQRYYESGSARLVFTPYNSGNALGDNTPFKCTKRTSSPVLVVKDQVGTAGKISAGEFGGSVSNNITPPTMGVTADYFSFGPGGISVITGTQPTGCAIFSWTADADL